MITAKFYIKPSRGSIHMTIKGHSQAAPKGEDLICASATMLAYTVAQAVQFLHEQGQLKKKPKIHIDDGEATIIATPTEEAYAEALHTFWVAQCGIHVLAHNYPQNVKLEHLTV
jgi:uncharacterized protein YsxB (DUF464 family)